MFLGYHIVLQHASAGKNINLQACMTFFSLKLEQLHKNLSEEHKQMFTLSRCKSRFTFTMEHARN